MKSTLDECLMKDGTQKDFFKLFYRAHRMAVKGNNPMDVISDVIVLAYIALDDGVMMRRMHKAKFSAEISLLQRDQSPLSLSTRLSFHKAGCLF
ncbi:hypothetical protein ACFFLZ_06350 [Photobacterium aphoticum]|uniref:Uncharacterized protein n=1 Tax=Photobacterium aphoticum TaxID=754436 RepID=A0A0J1GQQ5_9GAMM|nr:hypothetical protein [Photobacterium aphoticum]KLV01986.1 hypothetical protein ABT58_06265 [Photobacterium aphoticum]PSU60232.1 hypothetical protein C9I90_01020 [Photobacterium aphoticum]GHA34237.1 hypothetical protein GCM10007086_04540 [Photobacterium aphoticum]